MRREEIIARRSLVLRTSRGQKAEIRLGRPTRTRHGDWRCEYEVKGTPNAYSGFAVGVDAVQALELALAGLRGRLHLEGAAVRWLGEPAVEGLARHVPSFLSKPFRDRIEKAIETEERRLAAACEGSKRARRRKKS